MTAYDNNNPFAKILRGEFPCYKVYEASMCWPSSTSCRACPATRW